MAIKIKEKNKGKFTAFAKSRGMSVQQAARYVLRNKDRFSSTLIKRANFARNAAKWDDGGQVTIDDLLKSPTTVLTFADNYDSSKFEKYKKGGIHINPKNKGKFNALKKRTGKTTAELTHSKNPLTRKRAIFAQNAKKWKHADGGPFDSSKGILLESASKGLQSNIEAPTLQKSNNKYPNGSEPKNSFDLGSLGDYGQALAGLGSITSQLISKDYSKSTQDALSYSKKASDAYAKYNESADLANTIGSIGASALGYGMFDTIGSSLGDIISPSQMGEKSDIGAWAEGALNPEQGFADLISSIKGDKKFEAKDLLAFIAPGLNSMWDNQELRNVSNMANLERRQNAQEMANSGWTGYGSKGGEVRNRFKFGGKFKGKDFGRANGNSLVQDGEIIVGTNDNIDIAKNPGAPIADNIPMDFADGTRIISRKNSAPLLKDVNKLNKAKKLKAGGVTNISKNSLDKNINKYYARILDAYNTQEAKKVFATGGPYDSAKYVAPEDLMDFSDTYGSFVDNSAKDIPFSNPLDDPNDYRFNPKASRTNTQAAAQNTNNFNWGSALTDAGALLPAAYNIGQGLFGKRELLNERDYRNPYENKVSSLMRNRRFNVQPTLNAINTDEAIGDYNMSRVAGSRGSYLGNRIGLANASMNAKAAALANKQNMDLGYMGDEANMLYGMGRDRSTMGLTIADMNQMTKAAGRNMLSSGLTGVQQYLLNKQLMRNQVERDKLLTGAIRNYSPYANKWIPGLTNLYS